MKNSAKFHEHGAFIVLAYFASRALLLNFNSAEFTDGYHLIRWELWNPVRWHPLYPLLVKPLALLIDPVIAGRFVSILAGFGAMIVLAKIAALLYDQKTALLTSWIYIVSPLIYFLNLRVLTESLYQLLMFLSLLYLLRLLKEKKRRDMIAFLLSTGLAILTRPEALLFLPFVAMVLIYSLRKRDISLRSTIALLPWVLYLVWSINVEESRAYDHVMLENLEMFDTGRALTFLFSYVDIYPYASFYPFFFFAVLHIFKSPDRHWKRLALYFHVAFAVLLTVHTAWSARFLLIPVSILMIEAADGLRQFAGKGSSSRKVVLVLLLALSFVFSLVVITQQKEMFLDFKQSAHAVRYNLNATRVFSDEEVKTSYYLGRRITPYNRAVSMTKGDVLILHSFHTPLRKEREYLDRHYRYRAYHSSHCQIIPLLGMSPVSERGMTNSPAAFLKRFEKQSFQSVVLIIDGKITSKTS